MDISEEQAGKQQRHRRHAVDVLMLHTNDGAFIKLLSEYDSAYLDGMGHIYSLPQGVNRDLKAAYTLIKTYLGKLDIDIVQTM